MEVFEGRCQCGQLKYRVTGDSLTLFAYHCSECQRQSSGAFGMALWVETSSVDILSGELRTWTRRTPNGKTMSCPFCPACGSRIFHQFAEQKNILSIKPGTLNDASWPRPVGHIWRRSAQDWFNVSGDCLAYPANPQDEFQDMLEVWRTMTARFKRSPNTVESDACPLAPFAAALGGCAQATQIPAMKTTNTKIDAFLKDAEKWLEETEALRSIALDCGLSEKLKWGKPCYSFKHGNVAIIQPFKNRCAFMFFKGALLNDRRRSASQSSSG